MKHYPILFWAIALSAGIFTACNKNAGTDTGAHFPQSTEGDIIPGQYILMFKPEVIAPASSTLDWSSIHTRQDKIVQMQPRIASVESAIGQWLQNQGITPDQVLQRYSALQVGVALKLDDATFRKISSNEALASIEYDRVEKLPTYLIESVDEGLRAQTTPCGITNAGGWEQAGQMRWIWIVDSGIDLDHPDLNVITDAPYAASFVGGTPDDCAGHGTHVAGTAAAINNSIGVVGVAAGAPVVPVRVLDCSGSGSTATVIAGLNHIAIYDFLGDVINLSLGGYYGSTCANNSTYKTVLQTLGNYGVRISIASGNANANAANYQPGCVNGNNIFTVANMRCNQTWYNDPSYGGNYGKPPVDWIATGTSVYSTYLNGGYATLTGTSMAAPHVAGIMQVRDAPPINGGSVSFNGVLYPIARR